VLIAVAVQSRGVNRGGQRDSEFRRSHLDASHMGKDQLPCILQGVVVEMAPHGCTDHGLDLGGGHAGDRARELGLALRQYGRCVVPVFRPTMARGHAITLIVEDPPEQHGLGIRSPDGTAGALLAQSVLHCLEQVTVKQVRLVVNQIELGGAFENKAGLL
jgi:hypothetical protein